MSTRITGRGVIGHPGADSVVIEDGRVVAIGKDDELVATKVAVYDGDLGAPRHDHHFHPFGYAGAVLGLSLKRAGDLRGLGELVGEAARSLPQGAALVGNRLDEEALVERRLPNRFELDQATGEIPALLHRYCGHAAVANSAALALAGLRDHPDGILRETEIAPVSEALSHRRPALALAEVTRALQGLASLGLGELTTIVSAAEPLWCEVEDEVSTLIEIAPQLPLDLEVLVIADSPSELREAAAQIRGAGLSHLQFLGWKEFADGALGARTAALHDGFSDDPGNRGVLRLDAARATLMAETSFDLDGAVAIHAIGDRANDAVAAFFEILVEQGASPARLRVEHASLLTPTARTRLAHLGVTASVQPSFATSEVEWLANRLGSRADQTYAWKEMLAAGIPLVGGSDAPVEDPNPWPAMAAAVSSGLTPAQAYRLYGPAIRVGDAAHVIVTQREAGETRVLAAYRHGEPLELLPALELI